ncbi:3',5'-nucleoside bisphosphate phosphatase [Methylophilus sp. VKM B-3414]|uniref:3',5'-nucleoside bisphosphate phosphatase n=1 Tax=Methylophilus sp. VKM B-3414 TaxID=3076121 RepID=UPI0028C870C9|nr:3',5'-nucleoside bisphosphate phosphatase [Methylophilus sp. VKM B-3414]MDT7849472.1 3',5'-nucleoside bisphosphate phosphatase [Methylophilus sp. VKM B-3414]
MSVPIDLHCHSTLSDGLLSPEELVAHAASKGVRVLALTDHDEVGGLARARIAAEQHGITLVNGVEISVTWKKRTLHIVGLRIDASDPQLITAFQQVHAARDTRARQMAEGLAKAGIAGAYEGAKQIAGNSVMTRSHFAQFIVKQGHAKNIKSVFKKYMVKGKPGFVNHEWMSLEQAVTLIRQAGGVAVLAHPGRYDLGFVNMHLLLHEFRGYGGQAIEVVTGSHQPPQFDQFAKLAHRFDLKASQGSDYHGPGLSFMEMGRLPALPANCVPLWQDWPEASLLQ